MSPGFKAAKAVYSEEQDNMHGVELHAVEQPPREPPDEPRDEITALAVLIIERRAASQHTKHLEGRLILLLEPVLKTAARRHLARAGTLMADDLLQVARLAAFKCLNSFKPEKMDSFGWWALLHANKDISTHIFWQGKDVHLAKSDRFDSHKGKREQATEVDVESRDYKPPDATFDGRKAKIHPEEVDFDTPEALFADAHKRAAVSRAVSKLDPRSREIIRWCFGLAGPEKSMRKVAQSMGISRGAFDKRLKRAMDELRHALADLGDE